MMLDRAADAPAAPPALATASPLSRRENRILQLVAADLTIQQIADQLFTSRRTVETHRQNILEKTGCRNTVSLISYASPRGLLTSTAATLR